MPQLSTAKFILRLLDSFKKNEEKIAVVDQNGQRQTTYKELFTMACRVTGYLQKKNYPPHSFIGISLPTSMEYVAAEIGIWLAGHAIVPMGDKYPKDRIDYIMHHCESPLLINDEVIQAMMKAEPTEHYVLPEEEDINALFYTSGSTGTPKGVMDTFVFEVMGLRDEANSDNTALIDGLMKMILDIRATAKANKDWATSDKIRDALGALGVTVKDGKDGATYEL